MAIRTDIVKSWPFDIQRQIYTEKDTILYALSLGYGSQPEDAHQLEYVYEKGLRAAPAMVTTLCHPGFWISDPRTGIDASKAVHAEHQVVFHAPLPPRGCVRGLTRVLDLIDRGEGKGAMLILGRDIHDDATGALIASITQHTLLRADGGFSGAPTPKASRATPLAGRAEADCRIDIASLPQAALIYRLSADPNPLHVDPEAARAAGFDRPILHGLCTYGIVARAIIASICNHDAGALQRLQMRFLAPIYPGEVSLPLNDVVLSSS